MIVDAKSAFSEVRNTDYIEVKSWFYMEGDYSEAQDSYEGMWDQQPDQLIYVLTKVWSGATAEDIDSNIIQSLEPELRAIENVKSVNSTSLEGRASSVIEFKFGSDMQKALADVEAAVGLVDLPDEAETPVIVKAEFSDII